MTAKEHNKLLGIFLLIQGGLQTLGGAFVGLIYGGMGTFLLNARGAEERTMGGIFIVLAIVIAMLTPAAREWIAWIGSAVSAVSAGAGLAAIRAARSGLGRLRTQSGR